jgi:DNA-binding response OmpR family regulator
MPASGSLRFFMSLKGRSILIVEDEPLIAMDLARVFRSAGADATTTTTLKQAMTLLEHDGLSIAILDHTLSDGTCAPLCQRLKERNIPFVIYSGNTNIAGPCRAGTQISKPATMEILTTTVEALLPSAAA